MYTRMYQGFKAWQYHGNPNGFDQWMVDIGQYGAGGLDWDPAHSFTGGGGITVGQFGPTTGPEMFNIYCNCYVSAYEVLGTDPTYQNSSVRSMAQSAVDAFENRFAVKYATYWAQIQRLSPQETPGTMGTLGYFEGVRVINGTKMPYSAKGSAVTLPGSGIYVNEADLHDPGLVDLLRHEFGHVLQARIFGKRFFYTTIAPESASSVEEQDRNGNYDHQWSWTEWTANYFSYIYFGSPENWNEAMYPIGPAFAPGSKFSWPPGLTFNEFYSIPVPTKY